MVSSGPCGAMGGITAWSREPSARRASTKGRAVGPTQSICPALVVVLTREELVRLFAGLRGQDWLACRIMHGSGTRVEETCRIRVQDVDIEKARLRVWDGKGEKNRVTVLPVNLLPALKRQIDWRKAVHERDVAEGNGLWSCQAEWGGSGGVRRVRWDGSGCWRPAMW